MDCALDDVAASVVLTTDADHSMSDVTSAATQSCCESGLNEWSARLKMSLACMIGFRKQGRCSGRLIQVTQIPRKIVYAKVHIFHALCTALVTQKVYLASI